MRLSAPLALLCSAGLLAAEPKLTPRHDPPGQPFRRAPMAESARSVIVNLSTNLHYAFDTERLRVHTVWRGDPLNLWGPPYSYAKSPFICDFDGQRIYTFPQINPWGGLTTRFRSLNVLSNRVVLEYSVGTNSVAESWRGTVLPEGWALERTLSFPHGTSTNVSYIAFAEAGAKVELQGAEARVTSTNGNFTIRASTGTWSTSRASVAYDLVNITEEGTEKGFASAHFSGPETRLYLNIPEYHDPFSVTLTLHQGPSAEVQNTPPFKLASDWVAGSEKRPPDGDSSYLIEHFPLPPEGELLVTGMDWLSSGDLALCTWLGDVYLVRNATGDPRQATYHRFATGLNEPLGLATERDQIYVVQKGELTRLQDSDRDGIADRYECINASWGYSGNYHSYSFGPLVTPGGDFFVFITGQRGLYDLPFQGWALEISRDGDAVTPFCSGLRVPHGWGFYGPENDVFTTDNQGNWIGACRLNHLQKGRFYGFPSSTPSSRATPRAEDVEPPILWFPRSLAPSASGFDTLLGDRFGPFAGQLFIGDFQNSILMRACVEKVNGRWQGAVFPFAKGFLSGVNRVKFGPDGCLYVGGGKRTWSTAAPKEASLDRVRYSGKTPFEVREVHATADGFELTFTRSLDESAAADSANYLVKQFTYKYHQDYGSPEFDHAGRPGATELAVEKVDVVNDKTVRLVIRGLRPGYVTSFQLALTDVADDDLRNDIFFYTLNNIPKLPRH